MRRKRHHFIYEPDESCSKKEAEDAIEFAEKFLDKIKHLIRKKHPDLDLDAHG